ncbi:MAG: CRISPR-associated endonuclease Cas6 [Candidatus Margulisbacteria bacterium]|nr:CRISPR-associated endonuclease Cas6 [Candidatus Margulisiibacteriota bacterium]
MINLKIGKLVFENVDLSKDQSHKLRGYIGEKYKEYDLVHNHDTVTGKEIYRYPLFQFKVIDKKPHVISIGEKPSIIFKKMFMDIKSIEIQGKNIPIYEKQLCSDFYSFGESLKMNTYKFVSPWIGLNQDNYKKYNLALDYNDKRTILNNCLIGNIISVCKGLGYRVEQPIVCESSLSLNKVILKGFEVLGFLGTFKINFELPDYIGIGKSVSRGYGTIKKYV